MSEQIDRSSDDHRVREAAYTHLFQRVHTCQERYLPLRKTWGLDSEAHAVRDLVLAGAVVDGVRDHRQRVG